MARVSVTTRTVAPTRRIARSYGTALRFGAASTDKVSFVASTAFNPANLTEFTAAANVLIFGLGGNSSGRILDLSNGTAGKGFLLQNSGTFGIEADVSFTTNNARFVSAANILMPRQWYRVLMMWNDVDQRPTVYINGVQGTDATGNDKSGSRSNISTDTCAIGNRNSDNARNWNGFIDEVMIWNRNLTATEIVQDAQGSLVASSSRILHYKFDEGSGTTATDSSTSGINGTISGATYISQVVGGTRSVAGSRTLVT